MNSDNNPSGSKQYGVKEDEVSNDTFTSDEPKTAAVLHTKKSLAKRLAQEILAVC